MAKPDWIKINPTAGSNNGSFNVVLMKMQELLVMVL
jgi:hypothetical protein